jgi:hypothetical protein
MVESDNITLTPDQMRDWLTQEIRDLTKALELRLRDATEFVTSYSLNKITRDEAMKRLGQYDSRWGDPIPGVHAFGEMTDEQLIQQLDESKRELSEKKITDRFRNESTGRVRDRFER